MKLLKIDVTKINRELLFKGAKGTYLDAVMFEGQDQYGNDGWINQSVPKDKRGQYPEHIRIGTWKNLEEKPKPEVQVLPKEDDEITF